MVGPGRDPGRRVGGHSGRGCVAGVEIDLLDGPRPRVAQPWLARAFFLRFASLRFRFTDGFS